MKMGKNYVSKIILTIGILLILIIPTLSNAYTIGLKYNYLQVTKDTFVDANGERYTAENDMNTRYIIDGFNQSFINYTLYTESPNYNYNYLSEGNWYQYTSSQSSKSVIHKTINVTKTYDKFSLYIDLYNNPVYPGWSQAEFDQQNLQIGYNARYNYFDKVKDNVLDRINVNLKIPEIIDSHNVSKDLKYMKNKLHDMLTGNVSSMSDKIFDASKNNWYTWENDNLDYGVAYSVKMLNRTQGIVSFQPEWIGRYSNLNYHLNSLYFSSDFYPIQQLGPNLYVLNQPYSYISSNMLNQKINDTSKYVSVQEIPEGLKIDINTSFRTKNLDYFYNPTYSDVGVYSYHLEFKYDSNGFLVQKNSTEVFNAKNLGQYIRQLLESINTNNKTNINDNNNLLYILEILAIPAFLGMGASAAFLLKRKKK